jgi:hypothetical protein
MYVVTFSRSSHLRTHTQRPGYLALPFHHPVRYTIGYIDHDPGVHVRHLGPSLASLKGSFAVLKTTSEKCPAANYNKMLDRCKTPYLILVHQDVTLPPDLLASIDRTIAAVPEFGALGMVGVNAAGAPVQASPNAIQEIDTMDCCFIVVRRDLGVRFDERVFDELHQYVEDYCGQLSRVYGRKCYTILAESGHRITPAHPFNGPAPGMWYHHGHTFFQRGACWGNWPKYHQRLLAKWPGIRTT